MNVTGKINNRDGAITSPVSFIRDNESIPNVVTQGTLKPTDRKTATLEAERGETVVTQLDQANSGGIPEFYTIGGKRHSAGGTPLNLPADSFIYSRDKKMKITDADVLAQFGKTSKKKQAYTPADLSKQYDLNTYRQILADPNSDYYSIKTAKLMIQNYNLKLGGLAMAQESIKGFPTGIPGIAMPYLKNVSIDPMALLPKEQEDQEQTQEPQEEPQARLGGFNWPKFPIGGEAGVDEPVKQTYDFQNATNPGEYYRQKREQSGKVMLNENDMYNQWNQQHPEQQYVHNESPTSNTWTHVQNTSVPPIQKQVSNFTPGFKMIDGKQYQSRPTSDLEKYPSGQFEQATNANMASMYSKKYNVPNPYDTLHPNNDIASLTLHKLGGVPQYAEGGPTQKVPTLTELQKKGLTKWDMNSEGYDEASIKPGDYVKKADGKWYQTTMEDITRAPYTGTVDPALGPDLGEAYGRLEQRFTENKDLRKALFTQYKENMKKAQPKNNLSEDDLKTARGLNEDEVVKNFLTAQKQIMAIQAKKGDIKDEKDLWDKDITHYENTVKELGYEPLKPWQTAAFQGAFVSIQDLAKADPKFRKQLSDFITSGNVIYGKPDEGADKKSNISDIDGWFGNTTVGQSLLYAPTAKELTMKEADWNNKEDTAHMTNTFHERPTPFWTEDIINEAANLKNLWGIKKYTPWEAIPGTKLPNPTFASPDQQIQNILGDANQGVHGATAYGSPQGYMANTAAMHGNAMNNVANAISDVQNKNIEIANNADIQRANIMNSANDKRAQLATTLHDKNTIMNQQFDNAKTQAWDKVRSGMVNMWTNRGKTQNLNTLTDQYQIDPSTGYKYFTNGRPVTAKNAQLNDIYDIASKVKSKSPGMSWNEALSFAKASNGIPSPTGGMGVDPSELAMGYPDTVPNGYYQGQQ